MMHCIAALVAEMNGVQDGWGNNKAAMSARRWQSDVLGRNIGSEMVGHIKDPKEVNFLPWHENKNRAFWNLSTIVMQGIAPSYAKDNTDSLVALGTKKKIMVGLQSFLGLNPIKN